MLGACFTDGASRNDDAEGMSGRRHDRTSSRQEIGTPDVGMSGVGMSRRLDVVTAGRRDDRTSRRTDGRRRGTVVGGLGTWTKDFNKDRTGQDRAMCSGQETRAQSPGATGGSRLNKNFGGTLCACPMAWGRRGDQSQRCSLSRQ